MNELERLAALVAIETPLNPKHGTVYVRTELVHKIRAELERRKWDWRATHKITRNIEKAEKDARRAKVDADAVNRQSQRLLNPRQ